MSDLIKVGTTDDMALMMAVLQGGGELRDNEYRMRLTTAALEVLLPNGVGWRHTHILLTEATLYVSPETKFHAGDVLKLWEIDRSLRFKDDTDGKWEWGIGAEAPFSETADVEFFFSDGPFTLIPPAPPERDVFEEPMVGDRIADATGEVTEVNHVHKAYVVTKVKGVYHLWSRRQYAADHKAFTVVHRAEEGGGDE